MLLGVLGTPLVGAAPGGVHAAASASCTVGSGLVLSTSQPNATAPSTVTFQVTDPRGPPSWVNWSFGDGLTVNRTGSDYLSIAHLYANSGTFPAMVVLQQGSSLPNCTTVVSVQAAPLFVTIVAAPASGVAPLTVNFTARLAGGSGTYESAAWSFGNGQGGTGFNVSYTYEDPSDYTAVLIVVDSAGQRGIANTTVAVRSPNAVLSHGSPNGGLPWWEYGAVGGLFAVVALGVGWRWRRTGGRPAAARPAPLDPGGDSPAPGLLAGSVGGAGVVDLPRMAPDPGLPEPVIEESDGTEVLVPPEAPAEPEGPDRGRLKLSQRVMLHLYRQGHLADGEVAPVGFTQGGMSEQMGVAQSPLSSVLRRLVVAGLVIQDTRHVRGQPRRLRVYRLSPMGDAVARDLYLQSTTPGKDGAGDPYG